MSRNNYSSQLMKSEPSTQALSPHKLFTVIEELKLKEEAKKMRQPFMTAKIHHQTAKNQSSKRINLTQPISLAKTKTQHLHGHPERETTLKALRLKPLKDA